MKTGSLSYLERHLEKVVFGAAGLFTVAFLWMYAIQSPNHVVYNGRTVGARELDASVLDDARRLQQAVRAASAGPAETPAYHTRLGQQHVAGILGGLAAGEGPVLASTLPPAASFGSPILIPGQTDEQATNIVVVTPLMPGALAVRTGLSMAVRSQVDLAAAPIATGPLTATVRGDFETPPSDPKATTETRAVETAWVSIAAWFDLRAQQAEMTAARYEPYLMRVLFTGVDVERQVQHVGGGWSEWTPVKNSGANPKLEVPTPIFDSASGAMLNSDALDAAYAIVIARQKELTQPDFNDVTAGDEWETPPLDGLGPAEGVEPENADSTQELPVTDTADSTDTRVLPHPDKDSVAGVREQRAAADKALREARKAYRNRDYQAARRLAREAADNVLARKETKSAAQKLMTQIDSRFAPSRLCVRGPDQERQFAIWFHDDTVEPGNTYRYRMRAKLWNRYVGRMKAVRNIEDAKRAVLLGEWSLPSGAIAVAPSTHLFVRSPAGNRQAASVDVWKWRAGDWIKSSFDVAVGDEIGGLKRIKTGEADEKHKDIREDVDFSTGAIVLDLRFNERVKVRAASGRQGEFSYREVTSLVLVYLDPADGQIKERVQALDRDDPIKKKLERESEGDA